MSESQQNPSKDEHSSEDGNKDINSSKPIPFGPRTRAYASEPLQFRVRGSTITGASPPKLLTLEDIMKAAHGIQDMALAHEIAVDNDFRLEPFEPPDNSYHKIVKETMHRAFFDLLREELESDPPVYRQALVLLEDVKKGLFSILLPRHTRIRQMIEEVLDTEFIRSQAERGALDFHKYAAFVLDLMGKLAAPARDDQIRHITTLTDVVEIFRSILETLEVMKLDLANSLIAMIRPHVQQHTVQYEKDKFQQLLDLQDDGLQHTRAWLLRHVETSGLQLPSAEPELVRNVTAQALARAYLELLDWDDANPYPETVVMDAGRFAELSCQLFRLVAVASALLLAPTLSVTPAPTAAPAAAAGPAGAPPAAPASTPAAAEYRQQLKQRLYTIMDVTTHEELKDAVEGAAEEVVRASAAAVQAAGREELTPELRRHVRDQILALSDPAHPVLQLVRRRVCEFLRAVLVAGGGAVPAPGGLAALAPELTQLAGALLRCVLHNKAVYTHHYLDIVARYLATATTTATATTSATATTAATAATSATATTADSSNASATPDDSDTTTDTKTAGANDAT